jgi:hypothetical protein
MLNKLDFYVCYTVVLHTLCGIEKERERVGESERKGERESERKGERERERSPILSRRMALSLSLSHSLSLSRTVKIAPCTPLEENLK